MSRAAVDREQLAGMLTELRLPTIKQLWESFSADADREGWPSARLLSMLFEHELAERARRRVERHLSEARLPPGKSLDNFEFNPLRSPIVPMRRSGVVFTGYYKTWVRPGG